MLGAAMQPGTHGGGGKMMPNGGAKGPQQLGHQPQQHMPHRGGTLSATTTPHTSPLLGPGAPGNKSFYNSTGNTMNKGYQPTKYATNLNKAGAGKGGALVPLTTGGTSMNTSFKGTGTGGNINMQGQGTSSSGAAVLLVSEDSTTSTNAGAGKQDVDHFPSTTSAGAAKSSPPFVAVSAPVRTTSTKASSISTVAHQLTGDRVITTTANGTLHCDLVVTTKGGGGPGTSSVTASPALSAASVDSSCSGRDNVACSTIVLEQNPGGPAGDTTQHGEMLKNNPDGLFVKPENNKQPKDPARDALLAKMRAYPPLPEIGDEASPGTLRGGDLILPPSSVIAETLENDRAMRNVQTAVDNIKEKQTGGNKEDDITTIAEKNTRAGSNYSSTNSPGGGGVTQTDGNNSSGDSTASSGKNENNHSPAAEKKNFPGQETHGCSSSTAHSGTTEAEATASTSFGNNNLVTAASPSVTVTTTVAADDGCSDDARVDLHAVGGDHISSNTESMTSKNATKNTNGTSTTTTSEQEDNNIDDKNQLTACPLKKMNYAKMFPSVSQSNTTNTTSSTSSKASSPGPVPYHLCNRPGGGPYANYKGGNQHSKMNEYHQHKGTSGKNTTKRGGGYNWQANLQNVLRSSPAVGSTAVGEQKEDAGTESNLFKLVSEVIESNEQKGQREQAARPASASSSGGADSASAEQKDHTVNEVDQPDARSCHEFQKQDGFAVSSPSRDGDKKEVLNETMNNCSEDDVERMADAEISRLNKILNGEPGKEDPTGEGQAVPKEGGKRKRTSQSAATMVAARDDKSFFAPEEGESGREVAARTGAQEPDLLYSSGAKKQKVDHSPLETTGSFSPHEIDSELRVRTLKMGGEENNATTGATSKSSAVGSLGINPSTTEGPVEGVQFPTTTTYQGSFEDDMLFFSTATDEDCVSWGQTRLQDWFSSTSGQKMSQMQNILTPSYATKNTSPVASEPHTTTALSSSNATTSGAGASTTTTATKTTSEIKQTKHNHAKAENTNTSSLAMKVNQATKEAINGGPKWGDHLFGGGGGGLSAAGDHSATCSIGQIALPLPQDEEFTPGGGLRDPFAKFSMTL
ncbi:unnamed protein product [Amoebophrya sp. A120]|nr:unnamed protein product [Amoebophrya sp. A120]|eukprot:GSA120T00011095001.1